VLGRTYGVPLFQEQAMKLAMVAAEFTPDEANGLRRAMATFRNVGTIGTFRRKMVEGMVARGYDADFAERCFRTDQGLRQLWLSRKPRAASFAQAGLCLVVDQVPSSRGLLPRPAEFPADGLLCPAQIVREIVRECASLSSMGVAIAAARR
jgi:hypothetical protein